jgi:hypothetical protein
MKMVASWIKETPPDGMKVKRCPPFAKTKPQRVGHTG